MKLSSLHPTFKEALACHEVYRRLGFSPDDIYLYLNPDSTLAVMLVTQNKEFAFLVGTYPFNATKLVEEWTAVCDAVRDGFVSNEDLEQNYHESRTFAVKNEICIRIAAKGFWLPCNNKALN